MDPERESARVWASSDATRWMGPRVLPREALRGRGVARWLGLRGDETKVGLRESGREEVGVLGVPSRSSSRSPRG